MAPPVADRGCVAKAACRGAGTRPISASSAALACGPEIRTTPMAAGRLPEESA